MLQLLLLFMHPLIYTSSASIYFYISYINLLLLKCINYCYFKCINSFLHLIYKLIVTSYASTSQAAPWPFHLNKLFLIHEPINSNFLQVFVQVSAFQQHGNTLMVCDEDATLELRVRTVKYFKDMWQVNLSASFMKCNLYTKCISKVHASLNEDLSDEEMRKLSIGPKAK